MKQKEGIQMVSTNKRAMKVVEEILENADALGC